MGKRLPSTRVIEHGTGNTSQKRLFYQSPYKKVAGTSSPIGLPDNHIYERINQCHSLSKSQHDPHLHHTLHPSTKVLRFLEPGIWNFQNASEDSSDIGHFYDSSSWRSDSSVNSYSKHNLTLPRLPTIEQMFDNTNNQQYMTHEDEYNSINLPDVFTDQLVVSNGEEKTISDDDSEPMMPNSFGSLKKIDKVFSSKGTINFLLPPIVPKQRTHNINHVNAAHCDNNHGDNDKKYIHPQNNKQRNNNMQKSPKAKVNGQSRRKCVHFTENCSKSHIKAKPLLPKVVGLRLTLSEIKEREIPPVITKFFVNCKCQPANQVPWFDWLYNGSSRDQVISASLKF